MGHLFSWKTVFGLVSGLFLAVTSVFNGDHTATTPVVPTPAPAPISVATATAPQAPATTLAPKPQPKPKPTAVPTIVVSQKSVSTPGALILSSASSTSTATQVGALQAGDIITLTNAERAKTGLPPLVFNTTLSTIAGVKATDMVSKQYFAHIAPDGTSISALADQYGYEYLNIGENLALGDFDSSAKVVTGWMNSSGHRYNILNTQFTEIGVAAVQGIYKGKTVWYAVQEFGRPASACPSPDPLLKEKIVVYQNTLAGLETAVKNLKVEMAASSGDKAILLAKTNDYNTVFTTYNNLVATTKTAITEYNTEAQAFNVCAGLE